MKFAFVSRHAPTPEQFALATAQDIELIPVGDQDAFSITWAAVQDHPAAPFDGAVVVHPAAALRLAPMMLVGVYENANRAPEGERPSFTAVALHIYNRVD